MISRGNEQDGNGLIPPAMLSGHVDDWAELAVDYLDGRATPEVKVAIQGHLQECPTCAARLRIQKSVVTYLQETYLDDPPLELEDRILGEILFPSEPVALPRKEEPQGWTVTWNKRVKPWLPATVAVVALMAAIIGYGVARSGGELTPEVADQSQSIAVSERSFEATTSEGAIAAAPTTAAAATTTMAAAETTEPTVTVPAVGSTAPPETTAPEVTVDRKAMEAGLRDAVSPAYLAFMAAAPEESAESASDGVTTTATAGADDTAAAVDTGGVTPEQVAGVVSEITALTELTTLPTDLWLGGPTFAAYLSRDDAGKLVDLVRSIGTSVGLMVGLIVTQPAGTAHVSSRLLEHKRELCELIARRTAKPSVVNDAFTTSTMLPVDDQQEDWLPPDEAGTHVLVVIYVPEP